MICKERVDGRFSIMVRDRTHDNDIDGHVCSHCYGKFLESKYHKGSFRTALMKAWSRRTKDHMRF